MTNKDRWFKVILGGFLEIAIKELIRAKDVVLIKFCCPACRNDQLTGISPVECPECQTDLSNCVFDLEYCFKRNLIAIVRKIERRKISKKEIQSLLNNQEYVCMYCYTDLRGKSYHVDHIIPLAAGGTNSFQNLCISCPDCNLTASSKIFKTVYDKRNYIQKARKILK